jgi:hypothetical protein
MVRARAEPARCVLTVEFLIGPVSGTLVIGLPMLIFG